MGREDHDRELNDLVRRLRDLTDENFGDLDPFSTWGREMVASADAIEAQAKRIEELEKEINCWHEAANWPGKSPLQLRSRIAELEAALKPFLDNDWWEQIDWTDKTEREVWVTMADLRTARKVLGESDDWGTV